MPRRPAAASGRATCFWAKTGSRPTRTVETAEATAAARRGIVALNRSPLARKIIIFNLMALVMLVAGVLFMNPFRDSLVLQRAAGLVTRGAS